MPKYLLKVSYVGEGVEGLLADGGTKRRQLAERIAESAGGRVESFYFAFGETDVYIVAEFPDAASATAAVLTVNASGREKITTTVLLSPEEVDEAVRKQAALRAAG